MELLLKRDGWSLASRLWSMLFLVLAGVMTAFGVAAYTEARNATADAMAQSLANAARETSVAVGRSVVVRLAAEERRARGAPVVQAVRSAGPLTAAQRDTLAAWLDREKRAGDTATVALRIVQRNGEVRHTQGQPDSVALAALVPVLERIWRGDTAAVAPIFPRGARAATWLAVPVQYEGRTIGAVAQQVALGGSSNTERAVSRLTGATSRVFYVTDDSRTWLDSDGVRIAPLLDSATLRTARPEAPVQLRIASDLHNVSAAPIAATPWLVVIAQREDAVHGRITARGQRLAIIALVLLVLGTVGIIVVARRETHPLETVRAAADAMARGETPPTLVPHGASETASLIRSFNGMADALREGRATLEARNVALQQANDAKARFLAVMSHELRTPLHAIAGHTELLSMGIHGPVTEAQRHALNRIEHNNRQLLHLVTDVLHFSRQDALPLPLDMGAVAVEELFSAVLENVRHEAGQRRLTVHAAPTAAAVFADRHRLQQVVANLVANALRFTPAGGAIHLGSEPAGEMVRISVQDTGIGISPDKVARIFEPFVQLDEGLTREAGGAGLGLAIVRQLTEAMGGQVSVTSSPGVGSTFTVTMPLADETLKSASSLPDTKEWTAPNLGSALL